MKVVSFVVVKCIGLSKPRLVPMLGLLLCWSLGFLSWSICWCCECSADGMIESTFLEPLLVDNRIITAGFPDGMVVCVDLNGGEEWRVRFTNDCPVLLRKSCGKNVFVGYGYRNRIIDASTGAIIREIPTRGVVLDVSTNGYMIANDTTSFDNYWRCYSLRDGSELWTHSGSPGTWSRAVFCGEHVLLFYDYTDIAKRLPGIACLEIETGREEWQVSISRNERGVGLHCWQITDAGKHLFLLNGPHLSVVDKSTARIILQKTIAPIPTYTEPNRLTNWRFAIRSLGDSDILILITNPLGKIIESIALETGATLYKYPGITIGNIVEVQDGILWSGGQRVDLKTGERLPDTSHYDGFISGYVREGSMVYFAGTRNSVDSILGKMSLLTGDWSIIYSYPQDHKTPKGKE